MTSSPTKLNHFANGAFIVMKSERQRRRHADIAAATSEAQRLANASGTTFVVAREVASAKPARGGRS